MPEPSMGQPFMPSPGLRISVGDLRAPNGSNAQMGVMVNVGGGFPSPYIIATGTPFTLQAQLRTVLFAAPYALPNDLVTEFRITNLLTGVAAIPPVVVNESATPAPSITPFPVGDSGPAVPGDWINWYSIETPIIAGLPAGVYRVLVIGISAGMFFVHDDTVLLVR